MPGSSPCVNRENESQAHRQTKDRWLTFLARQLSGCFFCIIKPEVTHTSCPSFAPGEPVRRRYGKILWTCDSSQEPHVYDLLNGAHSVASEKFQFDRSIRPDITVLDKSNQPIAFIEFRKAHLSGRVEEVARARNIPLFVVDVLNDAATQAPIRNPQRMWYDSVEMDEQSRHLARMTEGFTPKNGYSSTVSHVPGRDGRYHTFVHEVGNLSDSLPDPSTGEFLLAHWTTLGCSSQDDEARRRMMRVSGNEAGPS